LGRILLIWEMGGGLGHLMRLRPIARLLADRRLHAPWGLAGGDPGRTGRDTVVRRGKTSAVRGKMRIDLEPGDRIRVETPGGGAHGPATE